MKKGGIFAVLLLNLIGNNMMAQVTVDNLVINKKGEAVYTTPRSQVKKVEFNRSLPIDVANLTVISNGMKFELKYGEDVVAYYASVFKATAENREYDNGHWVETLKKNPQRYRFVLDGKTCPRISSLSANTEYFLLLLPTGKDNQTGELTKVIFRTPKSSSQPLANISGVEKSDYAIQWNISKASKCVAYYMLVHVGDSPLYSDWSDVDIAFYINENKKNLAAWKDFGDYKQLFRISNQYFEIVTWGMDESGNMSGKLSRYQESLGSLDYEANKTCMELAVEE